MPRLSLDRFHSDAGGALDPAERRARRDARRTTASGRRRIRGEKGYVLVLAALLLLPLIAFAGFATDVGAWYARANRIQRAADAAALAGVVWMPDITQARAVALTAAQRNGFVNGQDDITITVSPDPSSTRKLRVEIRDGKADQFFSSLFIDNVDITRAATAEYILPVPLGSPLNKFGNDPVAGPNPFFWASIQGPYEDKNNGDPYATKCTNGSSNCSTISNSEYRSDGYLYAVEVPASAVGQTLTVELYDAGFFNRPSYPTVETADYNSGGTGPTTMYEMYSSDNTPLDHNDNPSLDSECNGAGYNGRVVIPPESSTYSSSKNAWRVLCTVTVTTPGVFPLRVQTSGIPGVTDAGRGWNQYAVRVCTGASTCGGALTGTQPRVYAMRDMSMFNNASGATADFYLAEVAQEHAGKTFQVSLYDPGDGQSGDYFMSVHMPNGSRPACTYRVRGQTSTTTLSSCRIQTRANGTNVFNGLWLDIDIGLPTNYTCTAGTIPGCWWKINYEFGGQPNDRTVWSAQIIGDPVHLVRDQ